MVNIRAWVKEKLIVPAKSLNGAQLGLAAGVGFWGGIFPIPALSTFATIGLCSMILSSMFNPAMTTIAISLNLAVTPLQLMFMPVFLDLPSRIAGLPTCSVSDLVHSIKNNPLLETCGTFGLCMIWATIAWALLAPLTIYWIRFLVSQILGRKSSRR